MHQTVLKLMSNTLPGAFPLLWVSSELATSNSFAYCAVFHFPKAGLLVRVLRKRYRSFHIYVKITGSVCRCTETIFFGVSKRVRKLTFKIVCSKTTFLEQKSVFLDFLLCLNTPPIRDFNLELLGLS